MKKELAIYGAGGLGRELAELAEIIGNWQEIFFIDDNSDVEKFVNGYKVKTYDKLVSDISKNDVECIIGVGEPNTRKVLYDKLIKDGFIFTNLIHPSIHIANSISLGKGVIIQAYSQITVNVKIEDNVFIQDRVGVGHDVEIGMHSVISGNCLLAGHVKVGSETYIGMSVPVIQGAVIGSNSIIGMGSVVVRDIPDNVIAIGNPARVMKEKGNSKVFK